MGVSQFTFCSFLSRYTRQQIQHSGIDYADFSYAAKTASQPPTPIVVARVCTAHSR
ncbi:Uncharacterised protein [Vibrio cholerae]|nr:Uncharacterised protein [Vibrio cholerae]